MNEQAKSEALASFAHAVGSANVLTDPDLVASYLSEPRGLYTGRALAIVRPGSTSEVSAGGENLRGGENSDGAAGRQHRPRRRPNP